MSSIRYIGIPVEVERAIQTKLRETAKAIFDMAVAGCPRDTGMMADKGMWRRTSKGYCEVGNIAPYAGFVERGTCKMAPRPFLRSAMAKVNLNLIWQGQYGEDADDVAPGIVEARKKNRFFKGTLTKQAEIGNANEVPSTELTKEQHKFMAERAKIIAARKKEK
jgi:HK97 gp10 family phage protein